jgi:cell division septum initiation protein DivIVA
MNDTQSAAELRRTWFRGVRERDVDATLGQLERRNYELEAELTAAREQLYDLVARVTTAEETLVSFHASFEHVGTMLSLAEERAREIERDAEAESARIRSGAEERVRAAEAEIESLVERKREALAALGSLRTRLVDVSEAAGLTMPAPEPELEEPSSKRVTVADLLALQAEGRLELGVQSNGRDMAS